MCGTFRSSSGVGVPRRVVSNTINTVGCAFKRTAENRTLPRCYLNLAGCGEDDAEYVQDNESSILHWASSFDSLAIHSWLLVVGY